jgi:acyl carrier protein
MIEIVLKSSLISVYQKKFLIEVDDNALFVFRNVNNLIKLIFEKPVK